MGGGFRVFHLVRPFLPFLPEVHSADRKVPFREKVIYTVIFLSIFLVCNQLPLYGIHSATVADPFYWMRATLASNRGTVMELGITPIVTFGLLMRLLARTKIIQVDSNVSENRALLNSAKKLLGILVAVGEAVAYVLFGMYGSVNQLGVGNALLIMIQLGFAGIIVICLDELLQRAYGPGSGISFFIVTNVCVAFYRQNLQNVTNLLTTGLVFLMYVLPLRSRHTRGRQGSYPIKLFYISNMPIILQFIPVSNLYFISQLVYRRFSGLAYYITAPSSLADMVANPFHALFNIVFILSMCAFFSKVWIEVSGSSVREVAKQLKGEKQYK